MKRICIICVMTGLAISGTWAAPRTAQEAMDVASEWMAKSSAPLRRMAIASETVVADSSLSYYVVNTGVGMVLVSRDDRLMTVLGYSEDPYVSTSMLPPALADLLSEYDQEYTALADEKTSRRETVRMVSDQVLPLVTSKWNQSSPFNLLAPVYASSGSRAVSGCVATAMAQIMYYHRHPNKGTGSHSYYWICTADASYSKTLSANFGTTTYDWANMLDSYKSSYTDAQSNAVATLMYHCGVAVDMMYGASSSAITTKVPNALSSYFGYDANYQRIQKKMYPIDSLNQIIRTELRASRPVLVSGSNNEGGHAFVCDGYNTSGYFHINWGWGGSSDGYYLLSALNPGQQGIGGTSRGYNQGTAFYIGLQPKKTSSPKAIPQMAADSFTVNKLSMSRSATFSSSIYRLENFGLTDFSGYYGMALYEEDADKMVCLLSTSDSYTLKAGYYRTTVASFSSLSVPSTVPNGTYRLCAVYKDANYNWMRMLCTQDDYYKTLQVTATKLVFFDNNAPAEVTLTKPIAFADTDSVPLSGSPLLFVLRNQGGTFRGEISARIYKGNFAKGQYESQDSVVIRRYQTFSSALQQSFDKNLLLHTDYVMKLCWRANKQDSWHDFVPAEYAKVTFQLYDPQPAPGPTTPLESTYITHNDTDKFLLNNHLYIRRCDGLYDILGHRIY